MRTVASPTRNQDAKHESGSGSGPWGVRHSPVITWQDLSEAAGPRASQEADPVGAGQGQGGTRPGADTGGPQ